MKRSGPPERRTPMPRGKGFSSSSAPPPATSLRRTSARKAAEQRARRELAQRNHGPVRCQWPGGCVSEAVDQDELLMRSRGGSATDPDNIVLLCRAHHDWKHQHPTQAQAMGLMPSRYPER